ncbi:MAG: hypothetical protein ABIR37_03915 [Candidatus Saccharimonadales bacterium]
MNRPVLAPTVPRRHRTSRALLWLLLFSIIAGFLALQYRRPLLDWQSLRNYTPPSAVTALATADAMTPVARHAFYVNHPSINNKAVFSVNCNFGREQSIVLGCYHGNQQGIYILDVSDPRLEGVEQVTAAHEMLHAAYDRLNDKERTHIDTLLQNFYRNDVSDPRVRATIDQYRKTEPNDVVNEMHSIFGTEIVQLTPELEKYYGRYFTDRAKVVNFASAYSQEFTSRQQQVATYDAQLKQLKATIETNTTELSKEQANLQTMKGRLDMERGGDAAQYNRDVDSYNAQVNAYNAKIVATRSIITQYNELVDTRNTIALEEQQLARAISGESVPSSQ